MCFFFAFKKEPLSPLVNMALVFGLRRMDGHLIIHQIFFKLFDKITHSAKKKHTFDCFLKHYIELFFFMKLI